MPELSKEMIAFKNRIQGANRIGDLQEVARIKLEKAAYKAARPPKERKKRKATPEPESGEQTAYKNTQSGHTDAHFRKSSTVRSRGVRDEVTESETRTNSSSLSASKTHTISHEKRCESSRTTEQKIVDGVTLAVIETIKTVVTFTDVERNDTVVKAKMKNTIEEIKSRAKTVFVSLTKDLLTSQDGMLREALITGVTRSMLRGEVDVPLGRLPVPWNASPQERANIEAENDKLKVQEEKFMRYARSYQDLPVLEDAQDVRDAIDRGEDISALATRGNIVAEYLATFSGRDYQHLNEREKQVFYPSLPIEFKTVHPDKVLSDEGEKWVSDKEWIQLGFVAFHRDQFATEPTDDDIRKIALGPGGSAEQTSEQAFINRHFMSDEKLRFKEVESLMETCTSYYIKYLTELKENAADEVEGRSANFSVLDEINERYAWLIGAEMVLSRLAACYYTTYGRGPNGEVVRTPSTYTMADRITKFDPSLKNSPHLPTRNIFGGPRGTISGATGKAGGYCSPGGVSFQRSPYRHL